MPILTQGKILLSAPIARLDALKGLEAIVDEAISIRMTTTDLLVGSLKTEREIFEIYATSLKAMSCDQKADFERRVLLNLLEARALYRTSAKKTDEYTATLLRTDGHLETIFKEIANIQGHLTARERMIRKLADAYRYSALKLT
ncbi:hypothetical protein DFP72DRAFT_1071911 [Ephemerocybe angulata]|uniref:Uncharacterized protein n=1 Tax=Ephemerocybe angulata TaxID=980116 RepID=A0A8H6M4D4_9AGAR|nr:hypothetical protein DFP72DRAFT_1071911 [Tulosesus angulatus]